MEERVARRVEMIKALAHPSRLMMVDELARGERCVQELQTLVGGDMSTVSKHLSVLKKSGLVSVERRGVQMFYSLRCACAVDFFECVESMIDEDCRNGC